MVNDVQIPVSFTKIVSCFIPALKVCIKKGILEYGRLHSCHYICYGSR